LDSFKRNFKLKRFIDELWNKFLSGGIANPLTAIEQITFGSPSSPVTTQKIKQLTPLLTPKYDMIRLLNRLMEQKC
jgi:hypothetical protein